MEFEFLPKLPKSELDERKFKDLVEECLLRIPRYCPEWTNYNPSDPGITLIELFAWLTDQMLMRFNQVPLRNYITFLELLGIHLQAPTPARTELTFYLTKSQPFPMTIPRGTEVATLRTETEEAIIFSTERELAIGYPRIKHFLAADIEEELPNFVRDRTPPNKDWENLEETFLFEQSLPGNCFYLILEAPESSIEGNVLAIAFIGEAARTTGINPDDPPRKWSAWNGKDWQPILRQQEDDKTRGFSFSDRDREVGSPQLKKADVVLHLPQQWPISDFGTNYRGHWIRCTYTYPNELQPSYSNSPTIVGISARAIGGAVNASQCIRIENELLGESNGKPGQTFELQGKPVLDRRRELNEYIQLVLPTGETEIWTEVSDFADSDGTDTNGEEKRHYTIDSLTGTVQFGPLIREPAQLKQQTQLRSRVQSVRRIPSIENGRGNNNSIPIFSSDLDTSSEVLERQYGKVPPPGALIYMVVYRTGGGSRGNVQAEKLTMPRASIPYVKSVVNYQAARNGKDAESLAEAVIRVPKELRTRECAVTPEDFENVAKKAHSSVAIAHCLTDEVSSTPGIVRLLIVPDAPTDAIDFRYGMNPDKYFALDSLLEAEIQAYMKERKPVGVQVKLQEPEYVGVSVRIDVILEPKYNNFHAKEEIRSLLSIALYRFLNPLTGGIEGKGWHLGRPVYASDIIALCQKIAGVRYLGVVELFGLYKYDGEWMPTDVPESAIAPGSEGIVCSWEDLDDELESGHAINFID